MAWVCLVALLAYLLVPTLHAWGVAECAPGCDGRGGIDESRSASSGEHIHERLHGGPAPLDEGRGTADGDTRDAAPDEHGHPHGPHDESTCQICLTFWLTHGGAASLVEPLPLVLEHSGIAASAAGAEAAPASAATHVRTTRGPPAR